ncbi:MAG: DMT family transporter, partial [Anaerolineae bacterium]|nr:DMT family transporter [Anaerolineae bacterium]
MRFAPHTLALLQALFVTFLWSTSWVLIKRTLTVLPPLLFAGLRYTLAAVVLLPAVLRRRTEVHALTRAGWGRLVALGLLFYALTQGGQFVTLRHLEAVTFSLMFSFSPVLVALAGIVTLHELPSGMQWLGMAVFIGGALAYFAGSTILAGRALGMTMAALTVCANAGSALLGRWVNRGQRLSPVVVTGISMSVGALVMLTLGIAIEGWPAISLSTWGVIAWLAVVNSAFAFTLWNRSLG